MSIFLYKLKHYENNKQISNEKIKENSSKKLYHSKKMRILTCSIQSPSGCTCHSDINKNKDNPKEGIYSILFNLISINFVKKNIYFREPLISVLMLTAKNPYTYDNIQLNPTDVKI